MSRFGAESILTVQSSRGGSSEEAGNSITSRTTFVDQQLPRLTQAPPRKRRHKSKTSSNDSSDSTVCFRWGATAPRSKRRKHDDAVQQTHGELSRLMKSLEKAHSTRNYHRCVLILSYLFHAGHLVNARVLVEGRYGLILQKVMRSQNTRVANFASAVKSLWKNLLRREMRLRKPNST